MPGPPRSLSPALTPCGRLTIRNRRQPDGCMSSRRAEEGCRQFCAWSIQALSPIEQQDEQIARTDDAVHVEIRGSVLVAPTEQQY